MKTVLPSTANLFSLLSNLLDTSGYLFWVYDASDHLVFANDLFFKVTGLPESSMGMPLACISTINGKSMYSLLKGRLEAARERNAVVKVTDEVVKGTETMYFESCWYKIIDNSSQFVAGYATDVTGKRRQTRELMKLSSRLSYLSLAASDTGWEWEAGKRSLHLNKRIAELTGYYAEVKYGGCAFWLSNVVRKEDRIGFLRKLNECIRGGRQILELEYSITTKSGEVRFVRDKMYFVYQHRKLVRIVGNLRDISDRKELEREIVLKQKEKESAVFAAVVQAQDNERDRISKELHDNINQLMLSSRMYIGIARRNPDCAAEMLDKACEYQLMAIEESRKLSHRFSISAIESNGLRRVVTDVVSTLKHCGLHVTMGVQDLVFSKLDPQQSLMVARILQELTSNIIKYAKASVVYISLEEDGGRYRLLVSDNGVGFVHEAESTGIGFANIRNRVRLLLGEMTITTSPGAGCEVCIHFGAETSTQARLFVA
jgi:PAS domain S-box-containing protein